MEEYAYVVNVDGVVVRDGEYLFIERGADEDHAAGLLGFPGGKVERPPDGGDALAETARRELFEEVGVEVGDVEYVHSSTFETDGGTRCLNVVALCEYVSGEAHPRATDEVAATHWLSSEDIEDREDVPAFTERYVELVEAVRTAD